ncbi:MAG: ligase-associated DNA damage response DEXH box helicase [Cyclobacteriaceae bacterium]|nr:ligase-associated DNA damage response DEXH box helicase [Cyclobacteriaceae bacterium]MCH8514895.1 ligase-associated DNA damage response DEXH box helicase [Cyclobacteriaceae bacterium]
MADQASLEVFDPAIFFENRSWKPAPFQKECWDAFEKGYSGLLNAPTGSGKTYAILGGALKHYAKGHDIFQSSKGLKIIWITPLRALAADLQLAMSRFLEDLGLSWKVGIRSGDTSASERQKQKKRMPDILITTPESLHLLLSQKDASTIFSELSSFIVDEWHEFLSTKRAVQIELAISRIDDYASHPPLNWALSATIGNLDEAMNVLSYRREKRMMVKADINKRIEMRTVFPEEIERFPWSGHLGLKLIRPVIDIIFQHKTVLIFTNTRSQCEMWYRSLMENAPELAGLVAMHHGSLDREIRDWVEAALHTEKLKAVVCTSSLDLGVDFAPVEAAMQVGSPKGISRFLQRAGRSGHRPGAESIIYFVPANSLELIEAAALRKAFEDQIQEPRIPVQGSMDVLVQYLSTLATGGGFYSNHVYEQIKRTHAYEQLSKEEFDWALRFVCNGGEGLKKYDEFQKVIQDESGKYVIANRKAAMRHRMGIGTIVSDPVLKLKYKKGGFIGTVEESFVGRLKAGDQFWFAGKSLRFERIKDNEVLVSKSNKKKGNIPRWMGGRMPLSSLMASQMIGVISQANKGISINAEAERVYPLLMLQKQWSELPHDDIFLIESIRSREGHHVFFYPMAGRMVHELMSALIAYRLSQIKPLSFSMAMNDYGFEILSTETIPLEEALAEDLFRLDGLDEDIQNGVNEAEMAKRKFRDIAAISGLIFQGYPGKNISQKHLQASGSLLFDVMQEYDQGNLLTAQALKEVWDDLFQKENMLAVMRRINQQKISLNYPERFTPFSFPIMVDRLRQKLSSESLEDRIIKMQKSLEKAAAKT